MKRMRSRRGSASALIVLMLVLLVFFGVLSVVTAAADNRLAGRRATWVRAYYEADSAAVRLVGSLRSQMALPASTKLKTDRMAMLQFLQGEIARQPGVEMLEADFEAGEDFRFRVQAGEQAIEVGLALADPTAANEGFQLTITRWTAWQKPFDYDGAPGGVWKGDL